MQSNREIEQHLLTSSILLLSAGIFIVDLLVPLGVAGGVPYVAVVLLSLRSASRSFTWRVAIGTSILVFLGALLSPEGSALWMVIINRFLALFAIWATAFLTLGHQRIFETSQHQLKALEQSSEGIVICGLDGRIQFANSAFAEMHGYTGYSLIGMNTSAFHNAEQMQQAVEPFLEKTREVGYHLGEVEHITKDGTCFQTRTSSSLLRDGQGIPVGFITIVEDMSSELELEAQLRQAQKLESIGRLAGGVAHDFNTLLGTIIGNCERIEDRLEDHEALDSVLEVHKAATRGAGLTKQLLTFSRHQIAEPSVTDLNELLRNLEPMLCRLLTEDIGIELSTDPKLKPILVDPGLIEQVIMNLAVNASDAMPRGGQIEIQTKNCSLGEERSEGLSELSSGEYVYLSIHDTGVGMDEETRSRVFEPFFTTKEIDKGTGLGLSMVYGIVRQSDGGITVESTPGEGSVFKIYFPATEEECEISTREDEVDSELATLPLPTETLLLVEDDGPFRELLFEYLSELGHTVLCAGGAKEALDKASAHSGEIDLLLTDVVMPDMNGVELAGLLSDQFPMMKTLYMSGYTDDILLDRAGTVTQENFIHKPFGMKMLLRKIQEVLRKDS